MSLDYRSIMSGRRKDPLAVVMRGALRLASIPYRWVVAARNRRFDLGRREIHRCGVPVISVGNLTTGGTGKTPIVCMLAKWFRHRGIRVAIVSRGYGNEGGGSNDEALELDSRLPDVPHVQDPDRVEAARIAIEELEAELIIMDDGFQHRRLHRDLDVVVIDATCPFGYGYLLPRGLLREPVANLRRADLVMVTRSDAADNSTLEEIDRTVLQASPAMPIIRSTHRPEWLRDYPETLRPIHEIEGKTVGVVSAIGNPEAFEATVRRCGATIVDARRLPDHDPYSPETVADLRRWAESLGNQVSCLLCTHKDLVKLQTDRLGGLPLSAVQIDLHVPAGLSELDKVLHEKVPGLV